jgi:hypothetical protein
MIRVRDIDDGRASTKIYMFPSHILASVASGTRNETHQRGNGYVLSALSPFLSLFPPKKEVTDQRDKKFRLICEECQTRQAIILKTFGAWDLVTLLCA